MAASKIFVLPLLAAPACFAFAAVGGSFAVLVWFGGLVMLVATMFLRTREWQTQARDDSDEDPA